MLVQVVFLLAMVVSSSYADCPSYPTLIQTLNYTNSAYPGDPTEDPNICILANEGGAQCGGCL